MIRGSIFIDMWKQANGTYELFVGSRMGKLNGVTPFALKGITNLINGKHILPDQLHTAALLVDVDGCVVRFRPVALATLLLSFLPRFLRSSVVVLLVTLFDVFPALAVLLFIEIANR